MGQQDIINVLRRVKDWTKTEVVIKKSGLSKAAGNRCLGKLYKEGLVERATRNILIKRKGYVQIGPREVRGYFWRLSSAYPKINEKGVIF